MPKILLFQPISLGDIFFTSALADIIKKHLPDSFVGFYTTPVTKEMLLDNKNIDEFILYTGKLFSDIKILRRYEYDYLIDTWAIGDAYYRVKFAKAKNKIFLRKKNSEKYLVLLVYTDFVNFIRTGYVFWDRIYLLTKLGIDVKQYIGETLLVYHISHEIKQKIEKFLEQNRLNPNEFILIAPKGLWKTKDIPQNLVSQVIDILQNDLNKKVVLASAPLIFSSSSIREFGALIYYSQHLLSVESLPYHLAVGLRKSATVIVGGYPFWKPPNYESIKIVNVELDCKFCSSRTCKRGDYKCLMDITPQMVMDSMLSFIG
ncbi:lipopolysaccharide heptosyltransferase family protein [Persephonella sp. KM09-Lau-8]|uniref:glycosyltransferase family 9 protein n=1 Tax=Persephonella sp. KM09-Lau-8 TaxID=1158345 RepID=UPI0004984A6F|nr:lipopolysaccharide heptosyltransferase family protein [Persephonella sp. KM09-Lau-8]